MNEDNVDTRPAFIPVNILNEHITYYIPPQRSEGRGGGGVRRTVGGSRRDKSSRP